MVFLWACALHGSSGGSHDEDACARMARGDVQRYGNADRCRLVGRERRGEAFDYSAEGMVAVRRRVGWSVRARFEDKVDAGPGGGCHLWVAGRKASGYGTITVARRKVLAHRLSWELANGPIPDGMCVLHRCDNPPCVNPDHLFLGTHADNSRDRNEKGRQARGVKNRHAKLTPDEVRAIRADTRRQVDIARAYGVTPQAVHDIIRRKNWRHI